MLGVPCEQDLRKVDGQGEMLASLLDDLSWSRRRVERIELDVLERNDVRNVTIDLDLPDLKKRFKRYVLHQADVSSPDGSSKEDEPKRMDVIMPLGCFAEGILLDFDLKINGDDLSLLSQHETLSISFQYLMSALDEGQRRSFSYEELCFLYSQCEPLDVKNREGWMNLPASARSDPDNPPDWWGERQWPDETVEGTSIKLDVDGQRDLWKKLCPSGEAEEVKRLKDFRDRLETLMVNYYPLISFNLAHHKHTALIKYRQVTQTRGEMKGRLRVFSPRTLEFKVNKKLEAQSEHLHIQFPESWQVVTSFTPMLSTDGRSPEDVNEDAEFIKKMTWVRTTRQTAAVYRTAAALDDGEELRENYLLRVQWMVNLRSWEPAMITLFISMVSFIVLWLSSYGRCWDMLFQQSGFGSELAAVLVAPTSGLLTGLFLSFDRSNITATQRNMRLILLVLAFFNIVVGLYTLAQAADDGQTWPFLYGSPSSIQLFSVAWRVMIVCDLIALVAYAVHQSILRYRTAAIEQQDRYTFHLATPTSTGTGSRNLVNTPFGADEVA